MGMDIKARIMPGWAIFRHDLGSLASSWLVRLWLLLSGLTTLFLLATQWRLCDDSTLISVLLFPYLVAPWFFVVFMLGVGPVAGARAESLSDGILSRPVTRYEYLLASWAARIVTVLGSFLVVVVPAILLVAFADRPTPADPVTTYGILAALLVVCLVLALEVSLAFFLGTALRRQMVAVALLAIGWFISATVLATFKLEELSPISLNQAMPAMLTQNWDETAAQTDDFVDYLGNMGGWLSGSSDNYFAGNSSQPKKDGKFFRPEDYADVTLWKVALGYGIPTLLSIGLATAVFCRRDL